MDERDAYKALWLQNKGQEAIPSIVAHLRDSRIADSCYAFKLRTKVEAKLLEKVSRKLEDKPGYSLENITDVVGLRLVALFRKDMAQIYEGLLMAMVHTNGISPNPFTNAPPEEVIIYKGHTAFDDLVPEIADITKRLCTAVQLTEKNSREGYSSIHLVTRMNALGDFGSTKCPFGEGYRLPIEIQVRTVFEDAWGEIDHRYGYVIRSGKETGQPIRNPEHILSHLKVLKKFTDACMDYAESIREEAQGPAAKVVSSTRVISVEADEDVLKTFSADGVQEELVEKYVRARTKKDDAVNAKPLRSSEANRLYLEAAELFRELSESAAGPEREPGVANLDVGNRYLYYYARMNEALCLMATNVVENISAASRVYKELDASYPEYPLLKMRLGQALGKLGHTEESLSLLRTSGELAERIVKDHSVAGKQHWPRNLPKVDYEHMLRTQPKLVGYQLWLKVLALGKGAHDQKAQLFLEAYKETEKCLPHCSANKTELDALHNNLLYYATGYLGHADERGIHAGECSTLLGKLREHLGYLEAEPVRDDDWEALDTLMKAYAHTGNAKKARQAAEKLKAICLAEDEGAAISPAERLSMIRNAEFVIRSGQLRSID